MLCINIHENRAINNYFQVYRVSGWVETPFHLSSISENVITQSVDTDRQTGGRKASIPGFDPRPDRNFFK